MKRHNLNDNFEKQIERYYQLWYDVRQLYDRWAKQHGTTYNAVTTIRTILKEEGHCTQKLICDRQKLPKQTVNTILKDFQERGYVSFSDLAADKRNKLIFLTEQGRIYAKEISAALYQKDFQVAKKMGLDRMEALIECLTLYAKYYHETDGIGDSVEIET